MGEKTEQPTEHKLRKAREEGQVAKSHDLTQTMLTAALFAYAAASFPGALDSMQALLEFVTASARGDFSESMPLALHLAARVAITATLPYLAIALGLGLSVEALQTRFLFSAKALAPKIERLDPVKRFMEMVSVKNLVELMKNLLKVAVALGVVGALVFTSLPALLSGSALDLHSFRSLWGQLMLHLTTYLIVCMVPFALFDLVWQHKRYRKGLMMSIDEVRQEYRQMEGDPHMKGHLRSLSREIAMSEVVQRTRQASVVVTNPTRLAIALRYVQGETPLPVVLCRGKGSVARVMRQTATECGIPVMENVPLARSLMDLGELDRHIPAELIAPVAELFRTLKGLADEAQLSDPRP